VNSKRHIAIDLRMYRMAGIGRYLQNLLSDLLPLLNASEISILGKSRDLADEAWLRDPRIQFQEFHPRIFSVAEQWAAAAGRYRTLDLLWIPQYNLPLLYRGKLVVTIHDLCQLVHPETLGNDLQRRYAKYLLSRVAKGASAILCVSEFTASEVQKYLQIDRGRLVVSYPPCGDMWGLPIAPRAESSSAPYLLTVGNIKKHKNLASLIAAYNEIRNLITDDLVIVGKREGFLNSETGLLADRDGRVRFTGQISDQELKVYYRNATALIFPSFYEGFGFPLVEAMAEGCPIACSNVASLPEVAGNAALFFDPFNVEDMSQALLQIATDARLRDALREQGRRRVLRFVGNTCAELTAATINRLLET
jgi:glycosyltransferase involved in cell wall biosynthesis